jgi:protein NirF
MNGRLLVVAAAAILAACAQQPAQPPHVPQLRGTGDLGLVVERAAGRLLLVETSNRSALARIAGLGDLSHASIVYSRDGRYGFVFGRDGGLTKVDLLEARVVGRVVQAGNAIGGAISQDGRLIAVANYDPGGVRLFDAATLAPLAEIPAAWGDGKQRAKVVGIADAPGNRFVWSLFEAGEIWIADASDPRNPVVTKLRHAGKQPYDALITPDGRHYIAGLYGEDGLALVDLWEREPRVRRILSGYGRGEAPLPVYKMPHLRGWAIAGRYAFLPAIGRDEVLVVDTIDWSEAGRVAVHGQPVFVVAQPGGRQVWVNFAFPKNGVVQVVDAQSLKVTRTLEPGRAVLHLEFTPRGEQVWISSRDDDRVSVFDTASYAELARLPAEKPSGIFLATRAFRTGF